MDDVVSLVLIALAVGAGAVGLFGSSRRRDGSSPAERPPAAGVQARSSPAATVAPAASQGGRPVRRSPGAALTARPQSSRPAYRIVPAPSAPGQPNGHRAPDPDSEVIARSGPTPSRLGPTGARSGLRPGGAR